MGQSFESSSWSACCQDSLIDFELKATKELDKPVASGARASERLFAKKRSLAEIARAHFQQGRQRGDDWDRRDAPLDAIEMGLDTTRGREKKHFDFGEVGKTFIQDFS